MFNNFPSAHEEESYPYIPEEQDLGTPASLESKLTFKLHLDALLGSLEDGTLELNEYGSDGFDCVIDDYEISLGTEENVGKQGRDYCMSIGEGILGENGINIYLDKIYVLSPWGTFETGIECDLAIQKESSEDEDEDYESFDSIIEDELVIYEEFKDFTDEESEVLHGYTIVTEGEAQELIQMLSEIVEAQG